MHFRLRYDIPLLAIDRPTSLKFDVGGRRRIQVSLRLAEGIGKRNDEWICEAACACEPPTKIEEIFTAIAQRALQPGSSMWEEWEELGFIGLEFLGPQSYRSFVDDLHRTLTSYARQTLTVLRWRADIACTLDPFRVRPRMWWSFDGQDWSALPGKSGAVFESILRFTPVDDALREEVTAMVKSGLREPLGHELLREARMLANSSPRSALILAISSLEVGMKECIADLIPNSQWLVENLPSPPLEKMLVEYLPKLPVKCTFDGKVLAPPQEFLRDLKTAIQIRNGLVHSGQAKLSTERLKRLLDVVEGMLLLLDFYRGHRWAMRHIQAYDLARALGITKA